MKTCFIGSIYTPYRRGGAEVVLLDEVKKSQAAGNEVLVITLKPWQGLSCLSAKTENIDGFKVYRFFALNLFSFLNINKWPLILRLPWHFFDLFNLHSYFVIRNILAAEKPEVVYTHNVKGLGYLTWRAVRKAGIKNIHTIHDVSMVEPSGLIFRGQESKINGLAHRIFTAICRYLIGSPSAVVSPSQWLLDFYTNKGFFPGSVKKVDLAFGKLPPLKQLNLKPEKETVNFAYIGQIEEHKGILWLAKNFEQLAVSSWQLAIIGDGSKLGELKKIVGDDKRFQFISWLNKEELEKKLPDFDFVIVPSLAYENSPTIITESLNKNIPVIAARIGGIGEMVKPGVNGFLFEPKNQKDFFNIVSKL